MGDFHLNEEMLEKFYRLNLKKKEIESALDELKQQFHQYFDQTIGENAKGQVTVGEYKLQRQIRTVENFIDDKTVERLVALQLEDLLVRKPDAEKIKSALKLGILNEDQVDDCRVVNITPAISVKPV
jgi:hypothetical protein